MFEVLNSRGLDVSWIDKLKSQLMAKVFELGPSSNRTEVIKELHVIWQDIFSTIGRRNQLTTETVRFAGYLKGRFPAGETVRRGTIGSSTRRTFGK